MTPDFVPRFGFVPDTTTAHALRSTLSTVGLQRRFLRKGLPGILSQDDEDCVSNSAAKAMSNRYFWQGSTSESLISRRWLHRAGHRAKGITNPHTGMQPSGTIAGVTAEGWCLESHFPYAPTTTVETDPPLEADRFAYDQRKAGALVAFQLFEDVPSLMAAHEAMYGTTISIAVDAAFLRAPSNPSFVWEYQGPTVGYHQVQTLGHDLDLGHAGAVRIENSWTDSWGDGGELWVGMQTLNDADLTMGMAAWEMIPSTSEAFLSPAQARLVARLRFHGVIP